MWRSASWVGLAAACAAALQLRELVLDDVRTLTLRGRLIDDAFFYTIVARHMHATGVPSFDGEMTTNGLQPGWAALTLAAQWLVAPGDSLPVMLGVSWALYALFAGATLAYLWRRGPERGRAAAALLFAGLIALNPAYHWLSVRGLEMPLLLALAPLLLVQVDRLAALGPAHTPPLGRVVTLALVAVALFFARTDWFWIPIVCFAWVWWRGGARSGAAFALVTALCVVPYLAANFALAGGLMPISGQVKQFYLARYTPDLGAWLASDESRGFVASFGKVLPLGRSGAWLVFPAFLAAGTYTVLRRRRLPAGLVVLAAASALHLLFMHLGYRELRPYTGYYFALELVWLGLVAALALGELAGSRPRLALAVAASLALAVSIRALRDDRAAHAERYHGARLELADDLRRIAPAGQRIAAFWPGALSYFSGRDVIPLDGVIGSRAYFERYVREERELDFAREHGVAYLAIQLPVSPEELRVRPDPPEIPGWGELGTLRLWQNRDVAWRTVAARPFNERGAGWYLIELPWGR